MRCFGGGVLFIVQKSSFGNSFFFIKTPPKQRSRASFGFASDSRAFSTLRLAKHKLTRVLRTVSPLRVVHCVHTQSHPVGFGFCLEPRTFFTATKVGSKPNFLYDVHRIAITNVIRNGLFSA